MASVTRANGANVVRLSSDNTASLQMKDVTRIGAIRFQAGTSSSIKIYDKDANGTQLYEADGSGDLLRSPILELWVAFM
jgi:hypothetical protein